MPAFNTWNGGVYSNKVILDKFPLMDASLQISSPPQRVIGTFSTIGPFILNSTEQLFVAKPPTPSKENYDILSSSIEYSLPFFTPASFFFSK